MTQELVRPAETASESHRSRLQSLLMRTAAASVRPLTAIIISLLIFAVILQLVGYDALQIYKSLVLGSVGSTNAIGSTLRWATPLILSGLAVALPLRAGLFNVGVEGQLYLGGFVSAMLGLHLSAPAFLAQPLAIVLAALVGALWAAIPAALLIFTGATEIVTTIMLSAISVGVVDYLVNNHFRDPASAAAVMTKPVQAGYHFPSILPNSQVSYGLLLAIVIGIAMHRFLNGTSGGYEVRMIGASQSFARYGGIRVGRSWLLVMVASGAIAGLVGAFETNGVNGRFISGFSSGYGLEGFLVAFLANSEPLAVLVAGLAVGALQAGSLGVAIDFGVPRTTISIMQGLIILLVSAQLGRFTVLKRLLTRRRARP